MGGVRVNRMFYISCFELTKIAFLIFCFSFRSFPGVLGQKKEFLEEKEKEKSDQASRPISISPLNVLQRLHA
jgi:hypothetical protein